MQAERCMGIALLEYLVGTIDYFAPLLLTLPRPFTDWLTLGLP